MATEALGGTHLLFGLKGCGCCEGLSLKWYFSLCDLSNCLTESSSVVQDCLLLGTNLRPFDSTLHCVSVSCLVNRFVIYLSDSTVSLVVLLSFLMDL